MDQDEAIGRNVARLRAARSQADVARAMRARGFKWQQGTLSTIEAGERPLKLSEAQALAMELGVFRVDDLVRPEPDVEISGRAREVHAAADQIKDAVDEYWSAQINLAVAADSIDWSEGRSRGALESWLTMRPEDVIAELRAKRISEGDAEVARLGVERPAPNPNETWLNLYNEHWDVPNGEHPEAP